MCFIMLAVPAYADETDSAGMITLVDDNFDSYTEIGDIDGKNNYFLPTDKTPYSIGNDTDNNKYLRMANSVSTDMYVDKYFTAVSEGRLEISFKFRDSGAKFGKALSIWQKDGGGNDFFYFFKITGEGKINASNGDLNNEETLFETVTANKWYTAKAVFDMKERKYTISVSDGETTKTSRAFDFGKANVKDINRLRFQCWQKNSGTIDFDDLCVKSQPNAVRWDDFEGYKDAEAMKNAGWEFKSQDTTNNKNEIAADGTNNKVFSISYDKGSAWATRWLPEKIESGIVRIKASIKTNNDASTVTIPIVASGGQETFRIADFTNKKIKLENGKEIGSYEKDKWYNILANLNFDKRKYDLKITDAEGTSVADSKDIDFQNAKVTSIAGIRLQSWCSAAANAFFDNVSVEKYYAAPTLPTSAVKVYNSVGTEVANWESIPTKCEIKLDFGTKMDASSLNIQTVKFVKKADNKSVAYSGSLSDSVYTITPSSLEPNTEYTVKVDKSVRNVSGVSMTEDIEISLKTANTEEQPDAVWVSDDFNSYTEIDGVKEAYTVTDETGVTLSLDDDNNDKSLKLSGAATSSDGIKIDKYFEETDDGKLEVSVRFKKNSTNFGTSMRVFQKSTGEWFYFFVIGSDGNAKAVYAPNGNYGNNPIQSLMPVVADKWYTAKAVFDMNARTYTVSVSDGTTEKTGTPINFSSAKVKEIDRVGIQSWLKNNNGTINFDDLNVKLFDAQFALKLGGVKNGDDNKDITKLTELVAAGDKAKLSLKCLNAKKLTADANVCIITAYYKNGECVKVEPLNKQTLATTQPNGAITYDLHIEDISGVNCIKIFVWDGSDNMKPYCGCAKF